MPGSAIGISFHLPPAELRRYFTTFYRAELTLPPGETVTDHIQPEWANLRFHAGNLPVAEGRDGTVVSGTDFTATGPSSRTVRFTTGAARIWGIGLLPLGRAKFVAAPAAAFADTVADGHSHPAFASFRPLARSLFGAEPDEQGELARITRHFLQRADEPVANEARIVAIHEALVDPEIANVAELAERAGGTQRTIERLCRRAFGFPPKLLLRRQRFMRSLAQFMLDPSMKWIGALDLNYYDQAQFVRDCKQFLGMTPREDAALDKPVIAAVMRERARIAGAAVQTLDGPAGGAVAA
jgi:methylphosphotriester-DNA--protein-cysteine methyltransferase